MDFGIMSHQNRNVDPIVIPSETEESHAIKF
jgi:hypothetical protein